MLERAEMEIFLTLAEELHFGRTAARLHVSPALVTQTVRKTERRLGAVLFERTSRRVALTEVGAGLRDDLLPLYAGIKRAMDRAELAGRGMAGMITVGFMGSLAGRLVHAARDVFGQRSPNCAVRIVETQLHHHVAQLRDGTADLLVLTLPVVEPGITVGPVLTRGVRFMCVAADHRLADRASVSAEELAGETFIGMTDSVPAYWADFHTPRRTPGGLPIARHDEPCSTYAEALALVAAGRAMVPGDGQLQVLYGRPDIRFVKVPDLPPIEQGLAWRTEDDGNGLVRAFADTVREIAPPLAAPDTVALPDR